MLNNLDPIVKTQGTQPQTLPPGEWAGIDFCMGARVYKPAILLRFLVIMMKKLK